MTVFEIDERTWEEVVTRKADPSMTSVFEKVIHDFVHTLLKDWERLRFENYALIEKSRCKGEWVLLELVVLGWNLWKWSSLQKISACTYIMWKTRQSRSTLSVACWTFLWNLHLETGAWAPREHWQRTISKTAGNASLWIKQSSHN